MAMLAELTVMPVGSSSEKSTDSRGRPAELVGSNLCMCLELSWAGFFEQSHAHARRDGPNAPRCHEQIFRIDGPRIRSGSVTAEEIAPFGQAERSQEPDARGH